jgi:tetratricopeptide (TPR) repeat protein
MKTWSELAAEIVECGNEKQAFRNSRLDGSGAIPLLVLSGSPYECGLAYGVLMHTEAMAVYGLFARLRDSYISRLPVVKRFFAPGYLHRFGEAFERKSPRPYVDEMKGFAEGAGIAYDEVLFLSSGAGLLSPACFVAFASSANQTGMLHGRNFDFKPFELGKHPILVRYEPESGVPYWNLSVVGYLPSFNGWNEAGLSVAINISNMPDGKVSGMPTGWKVREILASAKTIIEARNVIASIPNEKASYTLSVGSAREKSGMMFDLFSEEKAETLWSGGKPRIALNRIFCDGRYEADGLASKHTAAYEALSELNVERAKSAQRFFSSTLPDSPEKMIALLRDRSFPLAPGLFETDYGAISNEYTLFSIVFDCARGMVFIATGCDHAPARGWSVLNFNTRTLSPFLAEEPYLDSPEFKAWAERHYRVAELIQAGNLDAKTLPQGLGPYELAHVIYMAKASDPIVSSKVGLERLLQTAEGLRAEYPGLWAPEFWAGFCLQSLGDFTAAANCYQRCLELKPAAPNGLDALHRLAQCLYKSGDRPGARDAASSFLSLADECKKSCSIAYLRPQCDEMRKLAK